MAELKKIRALYIAPHEAPVEIVIANSVDALEDTVQGLFTMIYDHEHDGIIIANDEGKLIGMEGNRRIDGDVLVGPILVVGSTVDDICSLSDEQLAYYKERFAEPEDISKEEIAQHTWMTFCTF